MLIAPTFDVWYDIHDYYTSSYIHKEEQKVIKCDFFLIIWN